MPGLAGVISKNGVNEELLNKMVSSIKHEEFYRVDKYISSYFGIARVHLGTFNPEPQPIFNEDKSLCIFMDGKVYGYEEEMKKLKERGHKFNNENDPEFCLHSYEEYGKNFIKNLNGTFIFIICDLKNKKVTIANDRWGHRIHYYTINDGKLLFAPEAKAILKDETFKKELNEDAVAEFFAFGEFWGDKTFFKGIKVLPPASTLIYDGKELSIEKYWEIKYKPDYSLSEEYFIKNLVDTFKKAVKIRMNNIHRYGVSLSGGLDSRCVLAGIDSAKRKDVVAYTFGPKDCDEVKIAQKVANKVGTKHIILEITPELIISNTEQEVWLTDGRNCIDMSFAYPILKLLKDKITIPLDGFILDLTLGGSYLSKDRVNCESENLLYDILFRSRRLFNEEELQNLFVSHYYHKIKGMCRNSFRNEFNKINTNHLGNKSDQFFLNTHISWLPVGYVFTRNLFEVTFPTADNDFIDIIFKIPPEWRLNHRIYRKFLKKLSSELAKIPYDKTMVRADMPILFWKIGGVYSYGKEMIKKKIWKFSKGKIFLPNKRSYISFDEWFRTNKNWQLFFRKLLLDEKSKSEKYLNQDYIEQLFWEQVRGERDHSRKLLYIATFKIFLKLFF